MYKKAHFFVLKAKSKSHAALSSLKKTVFIMHHPVGSSGHPRSLYIQKRCMYEEYRYIYYFLPNVIANAQSGQDELTSCRCCWSKASGKSWLCCSNTGFAIYLFSFLPSYEWASKQDPIDLSVKQSLIRGQYHHYHHHQSKSCLPWPSTITPRVASCSFLLVHLLLLLLVLGR